MSVIVDIWGPERETRNFKRSHMRSVKECIWFPELPEDATLVEPYVAAMAEVLRIRVMAVIREWQEKTKDA